MDHKPDFTAQLTRKGFTLVELLTVIAIIGLLAGILIPTLGGVMDKARKSRSVSQIGQIKQALEQYRSQYHYLPLSYDLGNEDLDVKIDGRNKSDIEDLLLLPLSARTTSNKKNTEFNRKGITFYEFSDQEFNDQGHYVDAFGNTEFHVLLDGDGDNAIDVTAIDRREVLDTIEPGKDFIRGRIHLYVYPSDPTAMNAQLVTTWQ